MSIFHIARSYDTDSSNAGDDSPDVAYDNDWGLDKMQENICTFTKMRDLRKKMEALQLKRNKNNTADKSGSSAKVKRHKLYYSKSSTEIISEELERLGLVPKSNSKPIRRVRSTIMKANYILGLNKSELPPARRLREDSDSSDESRVTQVYL